ncbi:copper oxidase, partial [Pseudomonas sp. CCC2.2]|nr:copper oxidase [Pseudomonas sp. CCC2.2]
MGFMALMDHRKMAVMGDDSMQGMSGMDGGAMKDSSGAMQGMSSMQGMDHSNMSMGGMNGMGEMQSH